MKTMVALARAALLVSLGWGAVVASDLPERKAGGLERGLLGDLPVREESLGGGGGGLEDAEEDLKKLLEEVEGASDPAAEEPAEDVEEAEEAEEPAAEEAGEEPVEEAEEAEEAPAEESVELPEEAPEPPKAPAPKPKASAPKPTAPAPKPASTKARISRAEIGERPAGSSQDIFRELGLTREARREEAKALVNQARAHFHDGELVRAEGRLEEALVLDPQNEEAQLLLSEVRIYLGDGRGQVFGVAKTVTEEVKVQRDQAATEVRRLINTARRQESETEYAKAVESYELAIESIRNFPFSLNLDQELKEAQAGLARAEASQKAKEEAERQKLQSVLADQRIAEERVSLTYVENQIRELRRKAKDAEDQKKFERAITLYERILTINPRDEAAQRRLQMVKEDRHATRMRELVERGIENYDLAVLGIEESSVVYQQIFRYPEAKEWIRISPKVVTIEEEIAATETTVEKEIKRKLEQPYEIGFEEGVALKDALNSLQSLSGVNFVLNKEGAEAADKEVKLDRFPDLPLKNVLNLVLTAAGEEFGYAIKEGAVVVGPKDSLKIKEYLRFYEINDLIQEHPDFQAPPLALNELAGKSTGGAIDLDLGTEEKATGKIPKEKLLELIRKELGVEEGGDAISILGGKLSARTSLDNHLKLSKLLDQFRKTVGMMVTVESRFLDIQDNFLEEIGVDMGSPNSTFLPNSIPDIDGAGTSIAPGFEYVNSQGDYNARLATIGQLSQPLGSKVNPFNLTASGGGAYQLNVLKAERYQLEAILTAVSKDQEIRRLNSPRVTAFNGQVSHTLVVNQAAYIADLEVNQTGVIPVINPVIDVLNYGSILEVRPTIGYDRKYVVLEIQPTLAEQLDSDVAILNLSGNFTVVPVELPVLSVTKIKTTITVPDGGTVLVGGLKREITQDTRIGIPGLLDIPIVNLLWGRKGQAKMRSNLFVLINAKITIVHEEEARLFGV